MLDLPTALHSRAKIFVLCNFVELFNKSIQKKTYFKELSTKRRKRILEIIPSAQVSKPTSMKVGRGYGKKLMNTHMY